RFWAIQYLTQNLLETQRQDWMKNDKHLTLGDVVYRIRQEYFGPRLLINHLVENQPMSQMAWKVSTECEPSIHQEGYRVQATV
uniref:hypothetical protein n=1 Tax=Paenibacillus periandrae TaxID=1761741 RepID=UPI001F093886